MADWTALETGFWTKVAANLDSTYDKASMRLVCSTLDEAASLTVCHLPARLERCRRKLCIDKGKT